MTALHVIVLTTFFPNGQDPFRTVFVKNLVKAMRTRCELTVIAPVPQGPPVGRWATSRAIAAEETVDGIHVRHPRFATVPGLPWLSGLSYYLGALQAVRRVAAAARARGEAIVLHVHCAYPDAVGGALIARRLGVPLAVTAHGSDINVYAQRAGLRGQIRWALRRASAVFAVSQALRGKIESLLGGTTRHVIYLPCAGFDPALFAPDGGGEGERSRDDRRTVVFVGQLVPIKGLDFLVEAWSRLHRSGRLAPRDHLVLIGAGPQREALERACRAGGVGDLVSFLGPLPQAEVSRWIKRARVLCLPSRNEGTPNVVVESLACGTPVVASNVGGIPELVRDGVNGALVPVGDVEALADALARTLARDWPRTEIAASVSHLTWPHLAAENLRVLRGLAEGGAHAAVA